MHIVDEDNLVYEWYPYNTDTEKYDITINGNAIEKTVRHTLTYPYAQFNLRKDMELLTDGYIEDEFYYPEQSVTKYTYQISGVDLERYKHEYKGYLMRWYEYEIALEPEERIVNTVIAPIYPSINGRHEPVVYGYKYLLSPAKTWSEFGDLEIRINTPYFLIENSVKEFIKTDEGYSLKLDELPENELEFTLCSSQDPVYAIMPGRDYNPTGMIISIAAGVVLLSVGIIVYVKVRKRRKWNSNN